MTKNMVKNNARPWSLLVISCMFLGFGVASAQLPLSAGSEFVVNTPTLNIRESPGTTSSQVIGQENIGAIGTVVNSTPYYADGFWWWETLFAQSGLRGWVAQGYPDEPLILQWTPGMAPPVAPQVQPPAAPAPSAIATSGPRAWQTIHFGDSYSTILLKVRDLDQSGVVSRAAWSSSTLLGLSTELAGLNVDIYFTFENDQLHKISFEGPSDTKDVVEFAYNTLYDVQQAAHGAPVSSRTYWQLSPAPGFIEYGAIWRSNGIMYRVGIGRATEDLTLNYHPNLHLEWEDLSNAIIRDAADGF